MKENLISLDWENISTELVHDYSDEQLLEQCVSVKIKCGWGIVAEICKRFNERVKVLK